MSAGSTMSAKCPRSFLVACLYDLLDAAFDLEASQFLYCPCLQLGGVSYHGASFAFPLQMVRRNQIVRLNKDSAVKILCGIHAAGSLLVHEGWKGTDCARNSPIAHWHAKVDAIACIHAENIAIYGLPLCHRANDNGSVSFIEWAKNCPQQ